MAQQTPGKQLYDILTTRNFEEFKALDSKTNKPPVNDRGQEDVSQADLFRFDYTPESGKNYGTVVILIDADKNVGVYSGDNLGRTMDSADKQEWYDFLGQIKNFAVRNFLNFSTENVKRLRYSLQGQSAISEGLFESWSGNKTTSWNGKPTEARLMIRHKKQIGEGDARYRYIESLFIETAEGERHKLGFTKLSGGRAMLEHVRTGGKPYDLRGQHISDIVEELNVLSRFRRANHGKIFEGDTEQLVTETNQYYENLNKVLKGLGTNRGYSRYFESWNPSEITEQDVVIEGIKHLFITQNLDSRIEQALPVLAKIQKQGQAMKEANIFETWVGRLAEGTWALPDTPEKQDRLITLLNQELPVGPDATNATEQLYDLVGDDILFDELEALAGSDANADARKLVINRLQEFSGDPDVDAVLSQLNDPTAGELDDTESPEDVELDNDDQPPEEVEINDTLELSEGSTDDDDEDCSHCSGTGEGRWEGSTCSHCHGTGVEPRSHDDDDDFDIPDDDYNDSGDDESYYEKSLRTRGLGEDSVEEMYGTGGGAACTTGNPPLEESDIAESKEGDALLARIKSLALVR